MFLTIPWKNWQYLKLQNRNTIRMFWIISIPSKLFIFVCQTTWFRWNIKHWTSGVNVLKNNLHVSSYAPLLFRYILISFQNILFHYRYLLCLADIKSSNFCRGYSFFCVRNKRWLIITDITLQKWLKIDMSSRIMVYNFLLMS